MQQAFVTWSSCIAGDFLIFHVKHCMYVHLCVFLRRERGFLHILREFEP